MARNYTTTGGRIPNTTRVTASYTIDDSDHIVFGNTDAGAITITLPTGIQNTRYEISNKGTSGNTLTLTPTGTDNILGAGAGVSVSLYDLEGITITFDATEGWA